MVDGNKSMNLCLIISMSMQVYILNITSDIGQDFHWILVYGI